MHIPDGYLSPSTCAGLYAGAAPFWWVALRRIKRELDSRMIPLLSLFSAFSFVVMMFNLPLPGGTTGHAVGVGLAAIVLGPWVSILAISVALLIQALFFGDGGLTTFGANCFNMAVVGSLVAYLVYRLISARAALTSPRRVAAAALAGYAAINAAAFCAAVEFGIQPMLFHDASGAALYAPYPLSISIPAMMLGHLTFAGLAELVLTAGIVRYLQRSDPALLRRTAPAVYRGPAAPVRLRPRLLWAALAVMITLTPLGILAVGSAWGEWSAADFSNPATRRQIGQVSANHPAPLTPPPGLAHLFGLWNAPLRGYTPAFANPPGGYFLSAVIGVAAILLFWFLMVHFVWQKRASRRGFVSRSLENILRAFTQEARAETLARSPGLLQSVDPRVKLLGLGALIISAVAVHQAAALVVLLVLAVLLGIASRVSILSLATRVWVPVLAFTGLIALPALVLEPGRTLARFPLLGWPITASGAHSALLLILRAAIAATFAFLLVSTTLWNQLLRALRFLKIPVTATAILETSFRFIFLLLENAKDLFESRETRLVGRIEPRQQRRLAAAAAGVLLDRTLHLSEDVHLAMTARGFRGEIRLLDPLRLRSRDWQWLSITLVLALLLIWIGR